MPQGQRPNMCLARALIWPARLELGCLIAASRARQTTSNLNPSPPLHPFHSPPNSGPSPTEAQRKTGWPCLIYNQQKPHVDDFLISDYLLPSLRGRGDFYKFTDKIGGCLWEMKPVLCWTVSLPHPYYLDVIDNIFVHILIHAKGI